MRKVDLNIAIPGASLNETEKFFHEVQSVEMRIWLLQCEPTS
jgi:hypothetical protein